MLSNADLRDANLALTDLGGALLDGAQMRGADLFKTNLREADLRGADLSGVDLSSACYDHTTVWPEGFTPAEADASACTSQGERINILVDGGR